MKPDPRDLAAAHSVSIVEDDPAALERLCAAIEAHPELALSAAVTSVADGKAALDAAPPTVLLTDYGLPDGDGTELIAHVRERRHPTLCMVVTMFDDERRVFAALQAGALGYVLKSDTRTQIARSVLELIAGGSPVSPGIARYILTRASLPAAAPDAPRLTDKERDVLLYAAKGFTYKEIGRFMELSHHTVTSHIRKIYRKLSVNSRGEMVFEAAQLGLVRLKE